MTKRPPGKWTKAMLAKRERLIQSLTSTEAIAVIRGQREGLRQSIEPIIEVAVQRAADAGSRRAREAKAAQTEGKRRSIIAAVKKHLAANKHNSLTHARHLAANELTKTLGAGYSYDTVLRATKNLRK